MEQCAAYLFHGTGKVAHGGGVYEFGCLLVTLGLVDICVGCTVDDCVY